MKPDLTDATTFVRDDLHEFWREVRRSTPVYRHDGEPGFWVVARHADVLSCYADVRNLSSARGTVLDVLLRGADSAGGKMLAGSQDSLGQCFSVTDYYLRAAAEFPIYKAEPARLTLIDAGKPETLEAAGRFLESCHL